ncbi:hypothetical protein RVR_3114 [Actinacidiphila reveromycinica]|uniref:DUF2304 domain-containing protein n=1 Tax=Actinacidiphila reveromycinica TaxID=659352 RepID=A0A7U3UN98_9ACTN|nr:DUF2304 domain-containing protein [Streptomyces sp. SN-593]BBA97395.1 hypothetical protein RVR_3114 [Streptomyces sp. SN-593]
MLIQFVLLAAVVVLLAVFMRSWNTTRTRAGKRIAFLAFCFLNAYAVLRPGDTTKAAHLLGVGRGTDLVLYLLVVGVTALALNTYLRFRAMERRLTELARDAALRTAHRPEPGRPLAAMEGEHSP